MLDDFDIGPQSDEFYEDEDDYYPDDYDDDREAFASAGFGTDEDYGYPNEDIYPDW